MNNNHACIWMTNIEYENMIRNRDLLFWIKKHELLWIIIITSIYYSCICFGDDVSERQKTKNEKPETHKFQSHIVYMKFTLRLTRITLCHMSFAVIIYYYRWTLYQWTNMNIIFTLKLSMRMVLPRFLSCLGMQLPVFSAYYTTTPEYGQN